MEPSTEGLCIRVRNDSKESMRTLLFQRATEPAGELYIGAWDVTPLGPGAVYDLVLPSTPQVQGRASTLHGMVRTALRDTHPDTSWDIIEDASQALDIVLGDHEPGEGVVAIRNKVLSGRRAAVLLKGGTGLLARVLPPMQSVRFSVPQKLFIAVSSDFTEGMFYPASALPEGFEINYADHENVIVTAHRDDVGLVSFTASFVGLIPGFSPRLDPPF